MGRGGGYEKTISSLVPKEQKVGLVRTLRSKSHLIEWKKHGNFRGLGFQEVYFQVFRKFIDGFSGSLLI